MKVDRCDACKQDMEPGEMVWRLWWKMERMQAQPSSSWAEPSDGPAPYERTVCSPECFVAVIRWAMEDMQQWSSVVVGQLGSIKKQER